MKIKSKYSNQSNKKNQLHQLWNKKTQVFLWVRLKTYQSVKKPQLSKKEIPLLIWRDYPETQIETLKILMSLLQTKHVSHLFNSNLNRSKALPVCSVLPERYVRRLICKICHASLRIANFRRFQRRNRCLAKKQRAVESQIPRKRTKFPWFFRVPVSC